MSVYYGYFFVAVAVVEHTLLNLAVGGIAADIVAGIGLDVITAGGRYAVRLIKGHSAFAVRLAAAHLTLPYGIAEVDT